MLNYFSRYWFDFVWAMTNKEIKARYKRVLLGFLWVFLNPLLQMAVIGYVFQFFVPTNIDNYFFFLFSGLLPWNFFSYSLSKSIPIFLNERALIQKAKFPREALILSIIFSNFFHFLISLVLFVLLVFLTGSLAIFNIFILIVATILLLFFVVGITMFLTTWFVRYRDIKFIVQAILPVWFYATPIIYTTEILPDNIASVLMFNPMTGIIELFQFVFIPNLSIDYSTVLVSTLISSIIFLLGILSFRKEGPYFDDWL